jgi:hypothetical protein
MQDHSEHLAIGKLLKDRLEKAHAEYLAARTRFDSLARDRSIDPSHADGALFIQQSGLESRAAPSKLFVSVATVC